MVPQHLTSKETDELHIYVPKRVHTCTHTHTYMHTYTWPYSITHTPKYAERFKIIFHTVYTSLKKILYH